MSCDIKVFATNTDNLTDEIEYQLLDYISVPVSMGGYSAVNDLISKAYKMFREDSNGNLLTWDTYLFNKEWLKNNPERLEIVEKIKPCLDKTEYTWIGIQPF